MPLGSGVSNWVELLDVPPSFAGQATKFPKVNAGETALEFAGGAHLITLLEALSAQAWNQHFSNLLDPYGGMESWSGGAAVAPDGLTLAGAAATIAREAGTVRHGNYSAKLTRVGNDCSLSRAIEETTYYQNRVVTLGCWVWASVASRGRIQIADGVGTSESAYHTGGSSWEFLTVTRTIDNAAASVTPHLRVDNGNTAVYFDGAILVEGTICPTYMPAVKPVWLTVPIWDAGWWGGGKSDGDSAVLDLSAFGNGCPPGIKGVYFSIFAQDSDVTVNPAARIGPTLAQHDCITAELGGGANDRWSGGCGFSPCDANGDVYMFCDASGANTLDIYLRIFAYFLGE